LNRTIAAIRSGTDPVGKLPEAAFHRWLETPLDCPKCDVSYGVVADFEWATARRFDDESRGMVRLLQKAIQMGHVSGHRVSHFETSGTIVKSYTAAERNGP
jgi:hypothetical protein